MLNRKMLIERVLQNENKGFRSQYVVSGLSDLAICVNNAYGDAILK